MGSSGALKPKNINQPTPSQFTKNKTLSAFANKDYVSATNEYEKKNSNVAINRLENARRMYVKNTGGKLKDVTTSKGYQRLSELAKKEYKKRNPQDFKKKLINKKLNESLGKKSLLGKI